MSKLGPTVTFRLPPEVARALTIHSLQSGRTRSELVRECVMERYGPGRSFVSMDSKRLLYIEIALSALLSSHSNTSLQGAVQDAFAERLAKLDSGRAG